MHQLDEIERLFKIKTPQEIFGSDVEGKVRELQPILHPDRYHGDADRRKQAEALFKKLDSLVAMVQVKPVEIKSPKRTYQEVRLVKTGDVSDIYSGQADGNQYLIKVSRLAGADKMLDQERQALTKIHTAAADTSYRCYFPLLAESFPARDKIQRRVNVFTHEAGWYTLEQVLAVHKQGLHGRHLAWMFKRLLTALGFAHRLDLVHGAGFARPRACQARESRPNACGLGAVRGR